MKESVECGATGSEIGQGVFYDDESSGVYAAGLAEPAELGPDGSLMLGVADRDGDASPHLKVLEWLLVHFRQHGERILCKC